MPSRHATVTDQMHELLDDLRTLAQKELGHHGEIAADSQKAAVMLDIQRLEATISGIEPFDLLALTENDLEVSKGVSLARQAYNANPQETLVYRVQLDIIEENAEGDPQVERMPYLVTLSSLQHSEQDALDALSQLEDGSGQQREIADMQCVPFHGQGK